MRLFDLPTVYRAEVVPAWIDYNGHMTEYSYNYVFAEAVTAFMEEMDIGSAYLARTGHTAYTAEHHVTFRSEVKLGARLSVTFRVLAFSRNSIQMYGEMDGPDGRIAAAYESLTLHVRQGEGSARVVPFPEADMPVLSELKRRSDLLAPPRLTIDKVRIRSRLS
ncbi:thioesterase family protein [Ensifer soli]|uniref:thioesterase family protein n=1 Tax=Ciceribacter sp. sgz301302 TaxID=3342379 RepID=UPI0035B9D21C